MRKTFKFRLYPTKHQITKLNQNLENCRIVYNKTLEVRKQSWETEKINISKYDTMKMLRVWKEETEQLKETYAQVFLNVCERVDLAFRAFFKRIKKGEKPGYPKFKKYGQYDSFTYVQNGFELREYLSLSKIGKIKIKLDRPLEGQCKTLTIRRNKIGNWYACFSCIVEPNVLPVSSDVVGIDLGLTTFATLSTNETIERQRWMKQDEKDLKRIQRKISSLDKGSSERRKAIKALNHVYTRIKNRRDNFAHQESRKLVNRFGLIVFEDLDIRNMQQNGNKIINKGIVDVAWGKFVQFATYKAEEVGRSVILVNPKGTSQECSNCHSVVPKDLSIRVHDCPDCGLKIDRDYNAALNILGRGLSSFGENP